MAQPFDIWDGKRIGWATFYRGVKAACKGIRIAKPLLLQFIESVPDEYVTDAQKATLVAFISTVEAACDIAETIERTIQNVQ